MPEDSIIALGFDFGLRYIGIAVGQTINYSARSLGALDARDGIPNWDEVQHLFKTWQPNTLIVGLPLNMDGSMSHIAFGARKFSNRLQDTFQVPTHLVDERLSTLAAKEKLSQQKKPSRALLNGTAAQVILQQWLQSQSQIRGINDENTID